MFNPSRNESRELFFTTWQKYKEGHPLSGLESTTLDVITRHPEYHAILDQREKYIDREYFPESGEINPFLHMSLHVAILEQLSIDQPHGIQAHYQRLLEKYSDENQVQHLMQDCLAETLWQAQRNLSNPDAAIYLTCLARL